MAQEDRGVDKQERPLPKHCKQCSVFASNEAAEPTALLKHSLFGRIDVILSGSRLQEAAAEKARV